VEVLKASWRNHGAAGGAWSFPASAVGDPGAGAIAIGMEEKKKRKKGRPWSLLGVDPAHFCVPRGAWSCSCAVAWAHSLSFLVAN
jgi:hypothetical protein